MGCVGSRPVVGGRLGAGKPGSLAIACRELRTQHSAETFMHCAPLSPGNMLRQPRNAPQIRGLCCQAEPRAKQLRRWPPLPAVRYGMEDFKKKGESDSTYDIGE